MKKISKFIIAITISLFVGQSYAALLMSCDISANPMKGKGDSQVSIVDVNNHQHHYDSNHKANIKVSVEKIAQQPGCDSEQHNCQCSLGTCSSVFLPVASYSHLHGMVNRADSSEALDLDFQPYLLFRPPISS